MKESLRCPKCDSRRLWVIDPLRVPSEVPEGEVLRVVHHQPPDGGGFFAITRRHPVGHFVAYVCAACGLTEFYADDMDELEPDPTNGVRLVDNTDPQQGPFR
ncbi:MAG: hypothetical protein JRI68_26995 [Deltaproteobacteria bacterium]|nr:hypothetical protein [Deltaproteobacteria bacterium]